ncbi:MAG: type III PLP-dependent enzyme [Planctomycetota bacterium]|nr:type III PLP-dependent enzyme [Planctomycetota bacterium]
MSTQHKTRKSAPAAAPSNGKAARPLTQAERLAIQYGKGDPLVRSSTPGTQPVLDPRQFVPREAHKTRAAVMKLGLPKRIRALVRQHGTPLMVLDRASLIAEYQRFKRLLPRVELYYAIKANPHPDIIKTFRDLGGCFDVASEGEMRHVLAQGVKPSRIIFANTVKRPEALQFARKAKVNFATFDNEPELYKIAKHAPGCRVLARLKVSNLGSIVELSLKFGADQDQIVPMLSKARALGLKPEGVSFHVGSQCTNFENYQRALEVTAEIMRESLERGLPFRTVDIGGGFPIRHFKSETVNVETFANPMRRELNRLFPPEVQIIAEPGRALAGPAGLLITRVVGRSIRNNKNYYYLDDGVYGDFSGIVFDHCKYEFKTLKKTQKFFSILAGPTCDSFDTLSLSEELPELEVGDVVYVQNIGAYSCASALTFNGIPPAKVIVV